MNEVRCRVNPIYWWVVAGGVGMTVFMVWALLFLPSTPDNPEPMGFFIFMGIFTSVFGLASLYLFLCQCRGEIIADVNGVKWREAGKWRSGLWEETTYYFRPSPNDSISRLYIKTPQGELEVGLLFTNKKALVAFIESHARQVEPPPSKIHPQIRWPRVYHYQTWEHWVLLGGSLYIGGFGLWGIFFAPNNRNAPAFPQFVADLARNSWLLAAIFLLFTLGTFGTVAIIMALMPFQIWREIRRRKGERIEATLEGLTWTDGVQTVEIRWEEVEELRTFYHGRPLKLPHHRLQGGGKTVEWSKSIRGARGPYLPLPNLVRTYASHAHFVDEATEGTQQREQSGERASGQNGVFHFRTRDSRLALWGATFIAFCLTLPQYFAYAMDDDLTPRNTIYFISAAILLTVLFGWLCYFKNSLVADENGLHQRYFWGKKFIAWPEIRRYGHGTFDFVESETVKIRIPRGFLGNSAQLREIIQKRAFNSQTKEWDEV